MNHFTSLVEKYEISFLVSKYKDNGVWVLYNWLDTQNIKIEDTNHPLYQILEASEPKFDKFFLNENSSDFDYLIENKFIVNSQDDIRKIVEEKYAETNTPNKLELILMVANEACNFDCVYCYEDHSQKDRMGSYEKQVLTKFIEKLSLNEIGIDYFGGEPLLNKEFILSFNSIILDYANQNNIRFTSSMTTNGYLLNKELFEKFLDLKITNYQVTLDGNREDHDVLRPLVNGKGTFDKIYKNLVEISKLDKKKHFSITIRINFNHITATKSKREQFLLSLKNDFGGDNRFLIHPHPIGNWKNETDTNGFYMDRQIASEIEKEYEEEVKSLGFNPFSIVNYSGIDSNSCYADKKNNLVVFPVSTCSEKKNLKVQKCTVALKNPANTSGYISPEGELVKNSNWGVWVKNTPFKKEGCKSCFFVLNCYGSSCPLNTLLFNEVICPQEKHQEIDLVKRIVSYIDTD
ncbi:MAG TPA: radical SAM protein [Haliscomenobacter sp.]|uniref:radical SAM protein n=1 Tax=Haliscomenobacter sp. TaxID=2717303 RepID=UPI002C6EDC8B|nr:radical SAM protein [Haliscomenobacter sp.]HOY18423.1 radical SAM protein [Haliscomenobacter sp.]